MSTLRKMFGPSKEETWRQLCTAIEAEYVKGGAWKGDKVQAAHDEWTITLDTYAVSTGKTVMFFTRLRAPYVNPDHFRFTIYRRGLFSEIAKWLGMQDIVVGHEDFDRDFITTNQGGSGPDGDHGCNRRRAGTAGPARAQRS